MMYKTILSLGMICLTQASRGYKVEGDLHSGVPYSNHDYYCRPVTAQSNCPRICVDELGEFHLSSNCHMFQAGSCTPGEQCCECFIK